MTGCQLHSYPELDHHHHHPLFTCFCAAVGPEPPAVLCSLFESLTSSALLPLCPAAAAAFGQGSGFHTSPIVPDGSLPAALQLEGEFGPQPAEEQATEEVARAEADEHGRRRGSSRRAPSRRAAAAAVAAVKAGGQEEGELQVGVWVHGWRHSGSLIVCIGRAPVGGGYCCNQPNSCTTLSTSANYVLALVRLQAHAAVLRPLPRRQPSLPVSETLGGPSRTGRPLQTAVQRFNVNGRHSGSGHELHSDDAEGVVRCIRGHFTLARLLSWLRHVNLLAHARSWRRAARQCARCSAVLRSQATSRWTLKSPSCPTCSSCSSSSASSRRSRTWRLLTLRVRGVCAPVAGCKTVHLRQAQVHRVAPAASAPR
jgi:hypothetical protein